MTRRTKQEVAEFRAQEAARVAANKVAREAKKATAIAEANQRIAEREAIRKERHNARLFCVHSIISQAVDLHKNRSLTPIEVNTFARNIGICIQDMNPLWSGKISKAALANVRPHYKCAPVEEHYMSNQLMGNRILQHYLDNGYNVATHYEFDPVMIEMVDVARGVHQVTADENQRLRPYQKVENFTTWEDAYAAVGIELTDRFPE